MVNGLTTEQKLDHLIQLIEGDGDDAPGVVARLNTLELLLYGEKQIMGLRSKVLIMWRIHIWILCTISGLAGFGLHALLKYI